MRILVTIALIFALTDSQSCANNSEILRYTESFQSMKSIESVPQKDWKTQDTPLYAIDYPANWEMTYIGLNGISLIAISQAESSSDTFRENVTVIVQDLKEKNTSLETFVDNNTQEISDLITDSNLVEDEGDGDSVDTFQEVTYTEVKGGNTEVFTQRFYIHNGKGFIVIFSYQQIESNLILPIGIRIFNSFQLK